MFNFGLYPLVVGYVTLLLALLLMFAMTMLILKIGRIVMIMLKQAMFEPGEKIIKKVNALNGKASRLVMTKKPTKKKTKKVIKVIKSIKPVKTKKRIK
jgi:hypothetical protein